MAADGRVRRFPEVPTLRCVAACSGCMCKPLRLRCSGATRHQRPKERMRGYGGWLTICAPVWADGTIQSEEVHLSWWMRLHRRCLLPTRESRPPVAARASISCVSVCCVGLLVPSTSQISLPTPGEQPHGRGSRWGHLSRFPPHRHRVLAETLTGPMRATRSGEEPVRRGAGGHMGEQ